MKDFDSIAAVKEGIEEQSTVIMDAAKVAMMVVGTAVSVYYLTGKVMEFKLNRKMRQVRKENKKS